jgi:conjugative transposon TraN protein
MKHLLIPIILGALPLQGASQTFQAKNERPLAGASPPVIAATRAKQAMLLPIADHAIRGSYPLEASYSKTTHIIFPSKIIYVDLGSDGIIVDKADPTDNVLRIKANKLGFEQTTLVVITEEGKYYPFLVDFNDHPGILHLNMAGNVQPGAPGYHQAGFPKAGAWEGITLTESSFNAEEMKDLSGKIIGNKRFIKDVGVVKMRMSFILQGVYVHEKTLFLHVKLENRSDIDYQIDFLKFFIKDRSVTKRMASQEVEVPAYYQHPLSNKRVPHRGDLTLVLALPLLTYEEDKVLELQLYEHKGGRHLRFELDSDVIMRAKGL